MCETEYGGECIDDSICISIITDLTGVLGTFWRHWPINTWAGVYTICGWRFWGVIFPCDCWETLQEFSNFTRIDSKADLRFSIHDGDTRTDGTDGT